MKITLYANCFDSGGRHLMAVNLTVWRSEFEASSVFVPGYVDHESKVFRKAIDARELAASLKDLMTDLGHEVELEDVLLSSLTLGDHLKAIYEK